MELKSYWLAIRSGWKIILGVLVVALVVAAVLSRPTTPQYVSTTRLFVAANLDSQGLDDLYERNAIAQQRVASYVVVAMSSSVASEVSKSLGYAVDSDAVQAVVVLGTVVMEVSITDSDPERARVIAKAYSEVLPQSIEGLERESDSSEAQVEVRVIDEPGLPGPPPSPPVLRNLLLAIVLGLGAGAGFAVLRYLVQQEKVVDAPGAGAA